jgi:ABC-2 type transport system ATP-binding protein
MSTLTIEGLTVAYPSGFGRERVVLQELDLTIGQGEVFGLLGPNGAGKTTLIKAIIGLIGRKSGSVRISGKDTASPGARKDLGYMPEVANYYWFMTPAEILTIFGHLAGLDRGMIRARIDTVLGLVDLLEKKNDLVKSFSKGMQGRLNIAQALLHDPGLLILDEPFSGLDPIGRIQVRTILKGIKSAGKTILLSSHELSEAELVCDTLAIMKAGRILRRGTPEALLKEKGEHSLENYFVKMITEP